MREWGRIGTTGRERSIPFPALEDAQAALEKQCRVKERRGYSFHFRTELAHGIPKVES